MTTNLISSQLELHRLNTGRTPHVCTANRMLKQMLFRYILLIYMYNVFIGFGFYGSNPFGFG